MAHRLSTIRTADLIVAIDSGKVKEMGTHNELMNNKDLYYSLVMRQMANKQEDEDNLPSNEKIYPNLDEAKDERVDDDESKIGKFARSASRASRRLSRQMSQLKMGRERQDTEKNDTGDDDLPKIQMMRIMKRNSPEYIYIFIGVLASSAMGAVRPLLGIIFGNILGVLSYEDTQKARDESVGYAGWFVGLGLFAFLTQFIQVGLMSFIQKTCLNDNFCIRDGCFQ